MVFRFIDIELLPNNYHTLLAQLIHSISELITSFAPIPFHIVMDCLARRTDRWQFTMALTCLIECKRFHLSAVSAIMSCNNKQFYNVPSNDKFRGVQVLTATLPICSYPENEHEYFTDWGQKWNITPVYTFCLFHLTSPCCYQHFTTISLNI